jgi:hypothetical protein
VPSAAAQLPASASRTQLACAMFMLGVSEPAGLGTNSRMRTPEAVASPRLVTRTL